MGILDRLVAQNAAREAQSKAELNRANDLQHNPEFQQDYWGQQTPQSSVVQAKRDALSQATYNKMKYMQDPNYDQDLANYERQSRLANGETEEDILYSEKAKAEHSDKTNQEIYELYKQGLLSEYHPLHKIFSTQNDAYIQQMSGVITDNVAGARAMAEATQVDSEMGGITDVGNWLGTTANVLERTIDDSSLAFTGLGGNSRKLANTIAQRELNAPNSGWGDGLQTSNYQNSDSLGSGINAIAESDIEREEARRNELVNQITFGEANADRFNRETKDRSEDKRFDAQFSNTEQIQKSTQEIVGQVGSIALTGNPTAMLTSRVAGKVGAEVLENQAKKELAKQGKNALTRIVKAENQATAYAKASQAAKPTNKFIEETGKQQAKKLDRISKKPISDAQKAKKADKANANFEYIKDSKAKKFMQTEGAKVQSEVNAIKNSEVLKDASQYNKIKERHTKWLNETKAKLDAETLQKVEKLKDTVKQKTLEFNAISQGVSMEASSNAYDAALQFYSMDDATIKNSKGYKELAEKHPNLTHTEIKDMMAQSLYQDVYSRMGVISLMTGAVTAKIDARAFHFTNGSYKQAFANLGVAYGGEIWEENIQSSEGVRQTGKAINAVTKENLIDPEKGAKSAGYIGAIAAMGGVTVTHSSNLVALGTKPITDKVKQVLQDSRTNNINEQIQQSVSNLNDLYGSKPTKTPEGKDIQLSQADKEHNARVQRMNENIAKAVNEVHQDDSLKEILKDSKSQEEGKVDLLSTLSALSNAGNDVVQVLQDKNSTQEQKNSAQDTLNKTHEAITKIRNSIYNEEHSNYLQQREALGKQIDEELGVGGSKILDLANEIGLSFNEQGQPNWSDLKNYQGNLTTDQLKDKAHKIEAMLKRNQEFVAEIGRISQEFQERVNKLTKDPLLNKLINSQTALEAYQADQNKQAQGNIEVGQVNETNVKKTFGTLFHGASSRIDEVLSKPKLTDEDKKAIEDEITNTLLSIDPDSFKGTSNETVREAWNAIDEEVGKIITKLNKAGLTLSGSRAGDFLRQLHKISQKAKKVSDNQARVLLDKYIGGNNRGLLSPFQEVLKGKVPSLFTESHFIRTQVAKLQALKAMREKMAKEYKEKGLNPKDPKARVTPREYINLTLNDPKNTDKKGGKDTTSAGGDKIYAKYDNLRALDSVIQDLEEDMESFDIVFGTLMPNLVTRDGSTEVSETIDDAVKVKDKNTFTQQETQETSDDVADSTQTQENQTQEIKSNPTSEDISNDIETVQGKSLDEINDLFNDSKDGSDLYVEPEPDYEHKPNDEESSKGMPNKNIGLPKPEESSKNSPVLNNPVKNLKEKVVKPLLDKLPESSFKSKLEARLDEIVDITQEELESIVQKLSEALEQGYWNNDTKTFNAKASLNLTGLRVLVNTPNADLQYVFQGIIKNLQANNFKYGQTLGDMLNGSTAESIIATAFIAGLLNELTQSGKQDNESDFDTLQGNVNSFTTVVNGKYVNQISDKQSGVPLNSLRTKVLDSILEAIYLEPEVDINNLPVAQSDMESLSTEDSIRVKAKILELAEQASNRKNSKQPTEVITFNGKDYTVAIDTLRALAMKGIVFDKEVTFKQEEELGLNESSFDLVLESKPDTKTLDLGNGSIELSPRDEGVIEIIQTLHQEVQKRLLGKLPTVLNQKLARNASFKLVTAHGLMNFVTQDSEGKVSIPSRVIRAFTGTVLESALNGRNALSEQRIQEMLEQSGKYDIISILNSNQEELTDLSQLGSNKTNFIDDLGNIFISQLGYKISGLSQQELHGLKKSIGTEIFNLMHDLGLLETHTVTKQPTSDSNLEPVVEHYYQFKSVLGNKSGKLNSLLANSEASVFGELIQNIFNKTSEELTGTTVMNKDSSLEFSQEIKEAKKPKSLDLKTSLTTGNNKKLSKGVHAHNSIVYKPKSSFLKMLANHPTLTRMLMGYRNDVDSIKGTRRYKSAVNSKSAQAESAFNIIDSILSFGYGEDTRVMNENEVIDTTRIQQRGKFNTQGNKILRAFFTRVQYTDSTRKQEEIRTFKVGKDTSLDALFNEAQTLKNDVKSQEEGIQKMSYILGLAQALGVKVEKKTFEQIKNDLQKELDSADIKQLLDLLDRMVNNDSITAVNQKDAEFVTKMYERHGTSLPHLVEALISWNEYQNSAGKDFHAELDLEADGIANGMHNLLRMFTSSLSSDYLNYLKQTGYITFDSVALEVMNRLPKDKKGNVDFSNREQIRSILESLEGSAYSFATEGTKDPYQQSNEAFENRVAEDVSDVAHTVVTTEQGKQFNPYSHMVQTNQLVLDTGLFDSKQANTNWKSKVLNSKLGKIVRTGLFASFMGVSNVSLDDVIRMGNEDKVGGPNNLVKALMNLKGLHRNLAKQGVTPTVYGGMLTGITNQLMSMFNDKIHSELTSILNSKDSSENKARRLNNFIKYSSYLFAGSNTLGDINSLYIKSKDAHNESVIEQAVYQVENFFNTNKQVLSENMKSSVASYLYESIITTFGEPLANIRNTLSTDSLTFFAMMDEFNTAYVKAVEARNRKNGWVDSVGNKLTYKAYEGLTKAETMKLIKTLENQQLIATAVSHNENVLQDLIDVGNSIVGKELETTEIGRHTAIYPSQSQSAKDTSDNDKMGTVYQLQTSFTEAGASALTRSIVTVESTTQLKLASYLESLGWSASDVYDGIDALVQYANEIGVKANELMEEVFQGFNLMQSFYERDNRSTVARTLLNSKPKFTTHGENITLYADSGTVTALLSASAYLTHKNNIAFLNALKSGDSALIQEAIMNLNEGMHLKNIAEELAKEVHLKTFGEPHKESITIKQNPDKADIVELLNNAYKNHINMMNSTRDTVAKTEALKVVHTKLMNVVNQFGGGNRGFISGLENTEMLQQFQDFLVSKALKTEDITADIVMEFISTNPELQAEYNRVYEKTHAKLKLNLGTVENSHITEVLENTLLNKPVIKAYELVKGLKQAFNKLGKANTLHRTVQEQLLNIIEVLTKNSSLEVLTDANEVNKRISKYNKENGTDIALISSDGAYIPQLGIVYTSLKAKGLNEVVMHELVHGITADYFYKYSQGDLSSLTKHQITALNLLQNQAKEFSKRMLNDPEVAIIFQELLNTNGDAQAIRKVMDTNFNQKSVSNFSVALAYMAYSQQDLGLSQSDMQQIQFGALSEFYAYALTSEEGISRMSQSFSKTSRNREEFESMIPSGITEKGLKSVSVAFKRARDTISSFFGYQDWSNSTRNNLMDSLAALNVLGETNVPVKPNKKAKSALHFGSSINTVPHDNSEGHANNLKGILKNATETLSNLKDYKDSLNLVQGNQTAKEIQDNLRKVRQLGTDLNPLEEQAYSAVYGLVKVIKNDVNLAREAQQLEQFQLKVLDSLPFDIRSHSGLFKAEHNNLAHFIGMALAHELTSNEISKLEFEHTSTPTDIINDFFNNRMIFDNPVARDVSTKGSTALKELAQMVSALNTRNMVSDTMANDAKAKTIQKDLKKIQVQEAVIKIGEEVGLTNVVPTLHLVTDFVLRGQGFDEKSTDTALGTLIVEALERRDYKLGRKSLATTIARLFFGARENTQYAYKLNAMRSSEIEAIREKLTLAVPAVIEKSFSRKLNQAEKDSIGRVLLRGNLQALYRSQLNISVKDAIADGRTRNGYKTQMRNEIQRVIANELSENIRPQDRQAIMNYIDWQTSGLADVLVNGEAKGLSSGSNHGILQSTKAISSLTTYFGDGSPIRVKSLTYDQQNELDRYVGALVALKSMDLQTKEDLQTISDLYSTESKGMRQILKEARFARQTAENVNRDSLLGRDGSIFNRPDPHYHVKLVEAADNKEIERLEMLGYVHKDTLRNGELVMQTNVDVSNRFTTGALGLAEATHNGVSQKSLLATNDTASLVKKDFNQKLFMDIINGKTTYDNLAVYSNYAPVIKANGEWSGSQVVLPQAMKDKYLPSVENSYESLGNWHARMLEESETVRQNRNAILEMNKQYSLDKDPTKYIKLDGEYKPKGNTNKDIQFARRVNEFYKMLPTETKKDIEKAGGLYVRTTEIDNLIGYYQASATDIYTGRSGLPDVLQEPIRRVLNFIFNDIGAGKLNPVKVLKFSENLSNEVSQLSKDYILNRSFVVGAGNLISNIMHLWTVGVPVNQIPSLIQEGWINARLYTKQSAELLRLQHTLKTGNLSNVEQMKTQTAINLIQQQLNRNPVYPLVQNGIYTSISDLSNDNSKQDTDFKYLTKLGEKVNFDAWSGSNNKFISNVMIREGSYMHQLGKNIMDYGDFVAKYALYKHLTQQRRFNPEHAMNIIRDEFVDYSMNRGREFDWLNKVGLTWFLSYKVGIQKVILRNLRRNTLRSLAVWQGARMIDQAGLDPLGIVQAVPQQLFSTDYRGYHFEWDNMYQGFESHWLFQLRKILGD